jgi:two-component system LytT family response regulator
MSYRTILVDDEAPARRRLARLLAVHPEVKVVGEAGTGGEAVQVMRELQPDLAFLDIHLPHYDAFEVLRQVEHPPLVIFTTGHDQHALRAFEAASIDYLLKPVEPEALARSIAKLKRLTQATPGDLEQRLHDFVAGFRSPPPPEYLNKMAVRVGDRAFLIDMAQVTHFEAKDKYVFLHTAEGKDHLIDCTLSDLEARLDPRKFVRVHRSTLVNIDHIREIQSWFNGKFRLVLDDRKATEVLVSKGMAPKLKALVQF